MAEIPANGLRLVDEGEATGEVAELFEEIKREMGFPTIPNFMRAMASSPATLRIYWTWYRALLEHSTLPQSLTAMILYAIARQNNCQYCSASHELSCLTLGIDEATLHTLVNDLPHLTPERIRVTIDFALRVAREAKSLAREDYDRVRAQGVTDEEIVEIIYLAAMGSSGDVLADALKVEVDQGVAEMLGRN
jgi:uncharacterized peroxidase-related enzyme